MAKIVDIYRFVFIFLLLLFHRLFFFFCKYFRYSFMSILHRFARFNFSLHLHRNRTVANIRSGYRKASRDHDHGFPTLDIVLDFGKWRKIELTVLLGPFEPIDVSWHRSPGEKSPRVKSNGKTAPTFVALKRVKNRRTHPHTVRLTLKKTVIRRTRWQPYPGSTGRRGKTWTKTHTTSSWTIALPVSPETIAILSGFGYRSMTISVLFVFHLVFIKSKPKTVCLEILQSKNITWKVDVIRQRSQEQRPPLGWCNSNLQPTSH